MSSTPAVSSSATTPTALLLIDIQVGLNTSHGLYGTERSTPSFEENIKSLLSAARKYNDDPSTSLPISILHIFHKSSNPESPLYPDSTIHPGGGGFQPCAQPIESSPFETIFSKTTNSAFINTPLESHIRCKGIKQLIIAGIATDHCVSTSTRMAKDLAVVDPEKIFIISDATATFNKGGFDAEKVHRVNLASLSGEFANVVTTNEVLSALVRG
jgi:nicotinamidase-related amidase